MRASRLRPVANIGIQLTSFVGRERELAELSRLSGRARLVTLVGPAGVGKTRLAIELATALQSRSPGGVYFVDLAPLSPEASVVKAVADALGVQEAPRRGLLESVLAALRAARILLVLDNCEHVVENCARVCEAVLSSCPEVRFVTTSREALGVPGEAHWPLQPLRLPDAGTTQSRAIARSAAVRLFVSRAALGTPGFALDGANAVIIATICRRLEGIPLALELCAARVTMMPLEEILARLDRKFELLTEGSRTAPERQRTLRGTVDWSYDLLSDSERALFRRLSVFSGDFDLPAVEAAAAGGPVPAHVLPLLSKLIAKSLVVGAPPIRGRARYRMLETLREYAEERLAENREWEPVHAAHARYFLAVTEASHPDQAPARDQTEWLERVAADDDNLRAALEWSLLADPATLARLAAAASHYWDIRSHHAEGRRWLAAALEAAPEPTRLRARLLVNAGYLAWLKGDFAAARACLEESVGIERESGDQLAIGDAVGALGFVLFGGDDFSAAAGLFAEELAIARETGSTRLLIDALAHHALHALHVGDLATAQACLEEALPLARSAGDPATLGALLSLSGLTTIQLGDFDAARELLEEALKFSERAGDRLKVAMILDFLGELAGRQGDYEQAVTLVGISDRLYAEAGDEPPSLAAVSRVTWLPAARRRLGARADRLRKQGSALTDAEAVAFALSRQKTAPVGRHAATPEVSRREREVARLVADGLTNRQVAERLNLSVRTVDAHLEHVRNKLGVASRAQIASWAVQHEVGPGSEVGAQD